MGLIVGDVILECPVKVVDHTEHGLTWGLGSHGVKIRSKPPKLIVCHISGGEGSASRVYQTLTNRGYSIHFVIERGGVVWQFLDPASRMAAHTGGLNAESIGIEVVNAGWPVLANPYGRPLATRWIHLPKYDGTYLRTREAPALGCLPGQLKSLKVLVSLLCTYLEIPFVRADMRPYVPREERATLTGVLGHCQATMSHGDPTLDCLSWIPEVI